MQEENKNINLSKANSIDELLDSCPKNQIICDNLIRAYSIINNSKYKKIVCSISGGSDSDAMLDICWKCDRDNKIDYVWFDTGLEYQATKDHLKYLEDKYQIKIVRYKAIKPIPSTCREYGQPFISKYVSEMIRRLQSHAFKFEDKSFDELYREYPKCKSALKWWCNLHSSPTHNIKQNKWLKEFLIAYKPMFSISNLCCHYAKKDVAHKLIHDNNYDLNIVGIRKAEGGVRSVAYKNCYDEKCSECDNYRPLFWYKDSDKEEYSKHNKITYSRCYTEYGLKRTGCAGCPFGRNFEEELQIIEKYEPKLFVAVNNIFGDSYEYTRKYREFCKHKNEESGNKR